MPLDTAVAPDFFGTPEELAALRARAGDPPADAARRAELELALAWALRQRDTRAAQRHAEAAARALDALPPGARARAAGRVALVRGEAAWLFNRMEEALAELARACDAFDAARDDVGRGDAHLLHASLLEHSGGDRSGALGAARAAYAAAGDELRGRIAETWLACVEATARPDAAEARWGEALRAAAACGHPGLVAYAEAAQGTLGWRRGDPARAIGCFQRGVEAALLAGQLQSAVTLAQNIGIAFSTLGDHEGALDWAGRARAWVAPTGWPYMTGWCLVQTASILLGLGRAPEAQALLHEGLPSLRGSEGSRNHTLACQVLGEASLETGDATAALHWSDLALAGADRLGYPDLTSGTLRNRALALSRLGRTEDAVRAARQALAVAESEQDWQRIATTHHVLGRIALDHRLAAPSGSRAASAAIHHFEAALAAGARMPGFAAPPEWHAGLSTAHEAAGHPARALACERLASKAQARAQRRRAEDLAVAMLVRHETERARAEAERQRTQAEANALRAALLETQAALEKERMQSLLVHAGKLVALGTLASGVVHEMSHPVGTLMLLAESLHERLGAAPADVTEALGTLVGETRRLQRFVLRLRDFARAEPPRLAQHDLRDVVADARQLYAPRLALQRIAHAEEVPSLPVRVDPQRFALALANLVSNAADALQGRPAPQVRIEAGERDGTVALRVEDNGPGLADDVLARLFEPFFTTKPAGQGLGLGLALAAESLAAMGGRIVAANRPDGGACFTIVLPRAAP